MATLIKILLVFHFLSGILFAQTVGPNIAFKVKTLQPLLSDYFSQNWKIGYGAGINLSFVQPGYNALLIEYNYAQFSFDEASARESSQYTKFIQSIMGGKASIQTVLAKLKYRIVPRKSQSGMYATVMIGLSKAKTSDIISELEFEGFGGHAVERQLGVKDISPLWGAGVGGEMYLSKKYSIAVESEYQKTFSTNPSFGYIVYNVGIKINF